MKPARPGIFRHPPRIHRQPPFILSVTPPIVGSVTWGHITGVLETNIRTFVVNWVGSGAVENSGDAERLALATTQRMTSEVVNTGLNAVELLQNHYAAGDTVTLEFRHGASRTACLNAAWNAYSAPFSSAGFVQVRVTSTL